MTIEEKMKEMLLNYGLFPDHAREVMEKAKEGIEAMEGWRWNDIAEGYPSQFLAALWLSVKQYALAWIDENIPKA